jgi:hypothetical protein
MREYNFTKCQFFLHVCNIYLFHRDAHTRCLTAYGHISISLSSALEGDLLILLIIGVCLRVYIFKNYICYIINTCSFFIADIRASIHTDSMLRGGIKFAVVA